MWRAGALVGAAALAGCTAVGEDYAAPEVPLDSEWIAVDGATIAATAPADLGRWWKALDDPVLDNLVEAALAGSFDLAAALASVRQAAAIRGSAVGNRFPDIDGTGSYSRTRSGANGIPPQADPSTEDLWSLGLDFAWELDVWGRVSRVIENADADFEASVEDLRDVRALLVAEVVATYVDLRSGEARLAVAQRNVDLQQQSLDLTVTRFEAGAAPRLDVAQAQTNLANTEANLPRLEDSVRTASLRLGVLTGELSSSQMARLGEPAPLPVAPDRIGAGLPADLLRQRPDVRAAERRLAAEVAQVGVELADLYPRFSLGGSIGYEATSTGDLLDSDSGVFGIGPQFDWNLFDGGRERNEVRAQREAAERAYLDYRQAVLLAVEEVEGASYGLTRDQLRAEALERAADAARDSAELSKQLYLEGRSDFQNVLDSERSLFDAEDEWIASRADVVQRYVTLMRALGGGWQVGGGPQGD